MPEIQPLIDYEDDNAEELLNTQLDYDECPECGDDVSFDADLGRNGTWKGTTRITMTASCECGWEHKIVTRVRITLKLEIKQ